MRSGVLRQREYGPCEDIPTGGFIDANDYDLSPTHDLPFGMEEIVKAKIEGLPKDGAKEID
jgi:hypothetical protein